MFSFLFKYRARRIIHSTRLNNFYNLWKILQKLDKEKRLFIRYNPIAVTYTELYFKLQLITGADFIIFLFDKIKDHKELETVAQALSPMINSMSWGTMINGKDIAEKIHKVIPRYDYGIWYSSLLFSNRRKFIRRVANIVKMNTTSEVP